jgi:hypothetical protein
MTVHKLTQLICCPNYGLEDRGNGFRFQTGARVIFFSPPKGPGSLRDPLSLLCDG